MFHSYHAAFLVEAPKTKVAKALARIAEDTPGAVYRGIAKPKPEHVVSVSFYTRCCKWLDEASFTVVPVEHDRGSSYIMAYAESTNFCCSWCPSCIRSCFACCDFDDWGKNEAHIRAIVDGLKYATTELHAERGGDADDLRALFDRSSKAAYTYRGISDNTTTATATTSASATASAASNSSLSSSS
ncbi:uncharacterized protein AMSG_01545 [Thecamonas trahens ATCC 50062]|uniref:Uncharacterized protein n=1 Tax=Thecamonas trahens ATCC 50062 TaxID=461836 RepID=A0A0L0DQW7_THETB|nr:hypothetical protein AMSG_01545 [Thecamonas trahens ATCC 50062]KNC54694.1 hypothetical protein AMSG_01545 [Thecamonas trahens ATCC 50062]|eukprot:XP_013761596.1 hypothetical protein AMSG_01545 [Thecamonas trahens ATCC 50062]